MKKVTAGKVDYNTATLTLDKGEVSGDVVLVAIGRRPYSEGLGLDEIGVQKDKQGRVMIDSQFRTNIPSIYAIGDLCRYGPMLAHKASEEGVAAVDIIAGEKAKINYLAIPNVTDRW